MRYRILCLFVILNVIASPKTFSEELSSRQIYIEDLRLLRSRVESLYNARKNGDFDAIYTLMSSSYKKEFTLENITDYAFTPMHNLLTYLIESIHIEGDKGKVFLVECFMPGAVPAPRVNRKIVQNWVKESGNWYYDLNVAEEYPPSKPCGKVHRVDIKSFRTPGHCGSQNRRNEADDPSKRAPQGPCGR